MKLWKILRNRLGKFKNKIKPTKRIYIISYPKCGRTWLRLLIGKYLCEKYNFPDNKTLFLTALFKELKLPPIILTHDKSNLVNDLEFDKLSSDKSQYKGSKVIFLIRDIRDILVSSYFHVTKHVDHYRGDLSDFIKLPQFGIKKIIRFFNIWYDSMSTPKEFLLIKYEDIHENPKEILIKALKFIGLKEIDADILSHSIEFSSFDNMKQMEKQDFFNSQKMRPGDINDEESYKTRKGRIGGYKDYLSDEDLNYIEKTLEKEQCYFFNNHYKREH